MENKSTPKDKNEESNHCEAQIVSEYSYSSKMNNGERKSKKDHINEKKRNKQQEKEVSAENPKDQNQKTGNVCHEPVTLIAKYFRPKKLKIALNISAQRAPYSLEKIIFKRPYVTVNSSNRITGNFGHGSAIFRRPIIQGQFFMEFIVKQDAPKEKPTKYKSSVRVGLCHSNFDPAFPLGGGESIAYKEGGAIIRQGQQIESVEPFGIGDVIGILANIAPPHKYSNQKADNEGSSVTFYKNGSVIYTHNKLKQIFYCFAVSFYNYSQVDVPVGPENIYPMSKKAKHYYSMLNEKIPYKDLAQKKLFKL